MALEKRTIKNYCSYCGNKTNHTVLSSTTVKIDPPESDDYTEYQIVQCCGCECISFKRTYYAVDAASFDYEINDYYIPESTDCYPKTIQNYHSTIKEYLLPEILRQIYLETKSSIANDNTLLAGAGLRAIIDAICIDKKIKGADLSDKIDTLAYRRHITDTQRDFLHGLRFIGNDSLHGMEETPTKNLIEALLIVDILLNSLYILPEKSRKLPKAVISTYPRFKRLLYSKIEGLSFDTEYSLSEILGLDYRRVKNYISGFQKSLNKEVGTGKIKELVFGSQKEKKVIIMGKDTVRKIQTYKRVSESE